MLAKVTGFIHKYSGWFFILNTVLAFSFIAYKSIYQSASHLDDLLSLVLLIVFLGFSYHNKNWWGNWVGALLVFLLFYPPLYWLWRSGQYDTTSIAGLLPIQDMMRYYSDALRLHYGYPLSPIGSWRPLFIGYLSVILKLTNENLQLTLIVLAFFIVVSVVLLAHELKRSFGPFLAMAVVVILYYCYKGYGFIGKTLTEQLGLLLGVLALTLLLQGIRLEKNNTILLGLFTLTLALNARAGAFFIIPTIVLWGTFFNQDRHFSIMQFGAFLGVAVFGFFLNDLIFKLIGNSQGVLFENFSHTIYGLVTGYRGWYALYDDYGIIHGSVAWPLIIDLVRENPGNLLLGIVRAYADYLKPETMFRFLYFPAESQTIVSYVLYSCTLLGIVRLFRMRGHTSKLLLYALAGIFCSVPFVPPIDDGIRAMTATIPFSALILALPFYRTPAEDLEVKAPHFEISFVSGYTLGLIALFIIGPMLILLFPEPLPEIPSLECPGTSIPVGMWVKPGSFVRVIDNEAMPYSLIPDLRIRDLRSSTARNKFDFFNEGSAVFRHAEPGQTILVGHNIYTLSPDSEAFMMIVPTHMVTVGQIDRFCANHLITDSWGEIEIFLERSLDPSDFLEQ